MRYQALELEVHLFGDIDPMAFIFFASRFASLSPRGWFIVRQFSWVVAEIEWA